MLHAKKNKAVRIVISTHVKEFIQSMLGIRTLAPVEIAAARRLLALYTRDAIREVIAHERGALVTKGLAAIPQIAMVDRTLSGLDLVLEPATHVAATPVELADAHGAAAVCKSRLSESIPVALRYLAQAAQHATAPWEGPADLAAHVTGGLSALDMAERIARGPTAWHMRLRKNERVLRLIDAAVQGGIDPAAGAYALAS